MGRLQTVSQKVSLPPHPHKVSLCNSPGYPGTYYVDHAGLNLRTLPASAPKWWEERYVPHGLAAIYIFFIF